MATEQAVLPKAAKRPLLLDKYFYFSMSLLVAAVVVYGFSHTVNGNLIHATPPRPWILWLHGIVFSGWLVFFIFQSALVRTHNVKLHRRTGWFGVGLGVVIPVLGISTAIIMDRFLIFHFPAHIRGIEAFLPVQICDITSFTIAFGLAIYWRKKPEFHRRLVLIASCALTAAGFGRFPQMPLHWFYAGVDFLVLLGVARDLIVTRRVHVVYRYALPALIVVQLFVMHTVIHESPWWMKISRAILG